MIEMEAVLLEYIEKYGLTERARRLYGLPSHCASVPRGTTFSALCLSPVSGMERLADNDR